MKYWFAQAPFLLLLFILPFPGTVALRLLCLATAFLIAVALLRKIHPPQFPGKAVFAFWILVAVLSLTYAIDTAYSIGEIKNEIGYSMMALFAIYVWCRDQRTAQSGAWAVALSLAVISIWALWLRADSGYWHEQAGHGGSGNFAGLVLTAAPLLFLISRWQPRARWLLFVIAFAAVLAGAYSRQRALWPVLGIELGALVILLRFKDGIGLSGRRTVVMLAAIPVLVAILVIAAQSARVVEFGGAAEVTNDLRLRYWPSVIDRIADRPLFGAGFGRNAMKLGHPDLVPANEPKFWHAHNMFLNHGLAMGVPGIIALFLVFGSLMLWYWRMYRSSDRTLAALGISGLMLVAGVILRNLSDDFFQRDLSLLFWSVNGLLLGYGLRLQRQMGHTSP